MRKKIIFIIPVLAPYAIQRFEELAKDNTLEIALFVEKSNFNHRPGWVVKEVKGCEIEIIDSYIRKEEAENIRFGYHIKGMRAVPYRLPYLIIKHKPQAVIVCNATELMFCYLSKYLGHYKIGLVVEDTEHAVKNARPLKRKLKSAIYCMADFYLPFSDDSISYLKSIGIEKNIYRTSWSIDLGFFDSRNPDRSGCESFRHRRKGKLAFITIAQLIPRKGVIQLIDAWSTLPYEFQNEMSLTIIGDGPQKDEIKNFIQGRNIPNIEMTGHKPYEELISYLNSSDVFILPTLEDLFSLVVMEAMACRLPVLTTIYNGARELVKEGENGYVFDPVDVSDIRKAILRMFNGRERLKEMGDKSLAIIKTYSHEIVMEGLRKILHAI